MGSGKEQLEEKILNHPAVLAEKKHLIFANCHLLQNLFWKLFGYPI